MLVEDDNAGGSTVEGEGNEQQAAGEGGQDAPSGVPRAPSQDRRDSLFSETSKNSRRHSMDELFPGHMSLEDWKNRTKMEQVVALIVQ